MPSTKNCLWYNILGGDGGYLDWSRMKMHNDGNPDDAVTVAEYFGTPIADELAIADNDETGQRVYLRDIFVGHVIGEVGALSFVKREN